MGQETPAPKRRSRWRLVRRTALVLFVALLLLVLVPPLRNGVLGPALVRLAGPLVAGQGGELAVGGFAGDWWNELELTGVRLAPGEGSALPRVGAARLLVSWRIPALLRGDLSGLERVEADDVDVGLSLAGEEPPPEPEEPRAPLSLPESLPEVRVRGLELALDLGGGSALRVRGGDVAVDAAGADGEQPVRVEAREALWRDASGERAAPVELRGSWAGGALRTEVLRVDGSAVVGDGIVRSREGLVWDVELVPFAGGLHAVGSLDGDGLALEARAQDLDLAVLSERFGRWGVPALEGLLALDAELALDTDAPDALDALVLAVELALREPAYDGFEFDRVELAGRLEEGRIRGLSAEVVTGGDRARLTEGVVPLEKALGPEFLSAAAGELELHVESIPRWIAVDPELRVPEHRLDLRATLAPGAGASLFGELELEDGGRVEIERAAVLLPAAMDRLARETTIDAELSLDLPSLSGVGALLGREGWRGSLTGVVEASGPWLRPTGTLVLDGEDVLVEGVPLGSVEILAGVDEERIELATLESASEAGVLEASGSYHVEDARLEDVDFRLAVLDATPFGLADVGEGSLEASGSVSGPLDAPEGRWEVAGEDLDLGPGLVFWRVEASGSLAGGGVRVDRLRVERPEATVDAILAVAPAEEADEAWRADLEQLVVTSGASQLSLGEPATAFFGGGGARVEGFELAGYGERIAIEGRLDAARGSAPPRWEADVAIELGPLLGLAARYLPEGFVADELTVDFDGRGEGLDATGRLSVLALGLRSAPGVPAGRVELLATLADRRLEVENALVTLGDGSTVDFEGSVPLDLARPQAMTEQPVSLTARVDVPALSAFLPSAAGSLRADVSASGTTRELTATADLDVSDLLLRMGAEPRVMEVGPMDGTARIEWDRELRLEELAFASPEFAEVEAGGVARVPADLQALLGGDAVDPELDLAASFRVAEVAPLAGWVESLRSLGGSVAGDVTLAGTASAPRLDGRLRWEEGAMKLAADLPAFSDLKADVRLAGREIEIEELAGEMGGAPFRVGGRVVLAEEAAQADVRLEGTDLLLYRREGVKVRADANLRIAGPIDGLTASGEILLRDSRFVKNVDFLAIGRGESRPETGARGFQLFSFRDPPLAELAFDVRVTASQPFRIENNVVRGGVRPDLTLRGTGFAPELSGTIYIEPMTVVSLPAARLRMASGTIRFQGETWRGPTLEMRGEARARGYDVTVIVSGPVSEPEVSLASTPPLPRDDLIVLLLTGQTPETANTAAGAQNLAMFLALDAGSRWLSDETTEEDESLADRVDVFTGGDVSESGNETVEVSFRVTDDERAPRLIFLTAERDIYDRVNFGLRFLFRIP